MEWKYKGEIVDPEEWQWEAEFQDGSWLRQFDADGVFHRFAEIPQDKLKRFWMVNDDGVLYRFDFPKGAELIHFYRNRVENGVLERTYCFGFRLNGEETMFYILPNGELVNGSSDRTD